MTVRKQKVKVFVGRESAGLRCQLSVGFPGLETRSKSVQKMQLALALLVNSGIRRNLQNLSTVAHSGIVLRAGSSIPTVRNNVELSSAATLTPRWPISSHVTLRSWILEGCLVKCLALRNESLHSKHPSVLQLNADAATASTSLGVLRTTSARLTYQVPGSPWVESVADGGMELHLPRNHT